MHSTYYLEHFSPSLFCRKTATITDFSFVLHFEVQLYFSLSIPHPGALSGAPNTTRLLIYNISIQLQSRNRVQKKFLAEGAKTENLTNSKKNQNSIND